MTIKKCDKCGCELKKVGKDFDDEDVFACSKVTIENAALDRGLNFGRLTFRYELCGDCAKKLLEVLNGNRTL